MAPRQRSARVTVVPTRISSSSRVDQMNAPDMIVLDPKDNVATALRDLDGPATVSVAGPDGTRFELQIIQPIKLGHKVAIVSIAEDTPAIKHGEPFGLATALIAPGEHAHVHNIVSLSRI
jgi:altronate dehydratase small subunit